MMINVIKTGSTPTSFEGNSPPVIQGTLIVQSSEHKQVCAWEKNLQMAAQLQESIIQWGNVEKGFAHPCLPKLDI